MLRGARAIGNVFAIGFARAAGDVLTCTDVVGTLGASTGVKSMRGGAAGAGSVGVQSVGAEVAGMGSLGARMGGEGVAGRKSLTLGTGPIDVSMSVAQSIRCGSCSARSTAVQAVGDGTECVVPLSCLGGTGLTGVLAVVDGAGSVVSSLCSRIPLSSPSSGPCTPLLQVGLYSSSQARVPCPPRIRAFRTHLSCIRCL